MNPWAQAAAPTPMPSARVRDPDAPSSECNYALVVHLSTFALLFTAVPILGPILWLVRRNDSPFLNDHGQEAVNFQISLVIYSLVSVALWAVCGIGIVFSIATFVLGAVGCIMAMVASYRGEFFRYPMTIRLLG